jgi:phosphatidylserine decarboxylase
MFKITPTCFLSRIFGIIARIPVSQKILEPILDWYCEKFNVNTKECIIPKDGFKTFDEFFTRKLKPKARIIATGTKVVVSPVDALVYEFGKINDTAIIQAKGIDFSVDSLIPSDTANEFRNGMFITLYLSPGDYHRIHSPVAGKIIGYFNIPGRLFTVQEYMVNTLKGLFSKNERLISYIQTTKSLIAVCKIGAMNVGRISINHADVVTNKTIRTKEENFYNKEQIKNVKAGDEIGMFHLGSTIILLFPKNSVKFSGIKTGKKVKMGEKIGALL